MSADIDEILQETRKVAQPLISFDIDEESKKAQENKERYAESFFENVADYSKWVTSIALVALTLIATVFRDKTGIMNLFFVGSLLLILLSIVFSIAIIYCVLKFWKRNYDYYFDLSVYYAKLWSVKNNMTLYSPPDCENQMKEMIEKAGKSTFFSIPEVYTGLLAAQIIFFFFGLVCYAIGVNV